MNKKMVAATFKLRKRRLTHKNATIKPTATGYKKRQDILTILKLRKGGEKWKKR